MFAGLFRRRENELPPATPLQIQRTRQIETLRSCGHIVSEVQRDTEYRVNFTAAGIQLALEIHLPPSFPHDNPVVKICPPVSHPLVDDKQHVVGFPGLIAFSMHASLGRIIQELIKEFQKHPPKVIQQSSYMGYPGVPTADIMLASHPSYHPNTTLGSTDGAHTTDILNSFAKLRKLSLKELEELQESEEKQQEYVEKMSQLVHLSEIKDIMITENEQLAGNNMDQQPMIEESKRVLLEKIDEFGRLQKEFDESSRMFDLLVDAYNPSTLRERLQVAALEAEEESDRIADDYLDGKFSTEEFLRKFTEKRKISLIHRAKEEKLHQQLLELQQSNY